MRIQPLLSRSRRFSGGIWSLGLTLAALHACAPTRLESHDASAIRAVVDAVRLHAESVKDFVDPREPLLVDVQSFVIGGRAALGEPVSKEDVVTVLPDAHRDVTRAYAVQCPSGAGSRRCGVRGDALFIQLDSMRLTSKGFAAVATYVWTDRRSSGNSAIGRSQIRMTFERSGGEWVLRETRVGSTT